MNMNISRAAKQHDEQVVRFSDQTPDWVYSVPSNPDSTFSTTDTSDSTLAQFFARPIRIAHFNWEIGVMPYTYLDPWTTYLSNLRIVNRINNFNLTRAKLHIKVVLNGNGFYFGRLIASYIPRPTEISGISLPVVNFRQDLIKLSQLPHVLLDPTTSQGGELVLPFFHTENNLCVPASAFAQMGVLIIDELNPLRHANNGTDPISVSVFCWAEGLELSIPTSTACGAIVPQMGDEYGLKPVSKTANTVARAAGALSKIPTIAPYAKATEAAAKAVGEVASIFGYSRPPTLGEPGFVVPQHVGTLANVNLPEAVTKLTLDAKQEVTVDPRVVGLSDADEMSILSLSKRESFINTFQWTVNESTDSVLGSHTVHPMKFHQDDTYPDYLRPYTLTPMAFATLPFRFWRGTMKFRFQIVCSAFHKGRLRIVYDPYILQPGSISEYNINYSYVVDIAEEKDFTLEIGWGQPVSWRPVTDLETTQYSSGVANDYVFSTSESLASNGVLSIVVVNELTVPNTVDPAPIDINVFVSTGDDFEVCVPDCTKLAKLSYSRIPPPGPGIVAPPEMEAQSGEPVDTADAVNESVPISLETQHTLAPTLPLRDHTLDVFFGDPVVSFRQCLKRYNFSRAWPLSGTSLAAGTRFFSFRLPDIPLYRGSTGGALDVAISPAGVVTVPWNYVKMTLLNYLLPAYAARRGGIRWKYQLVGHNPAHSPVMMVTADNPGAGYSTASTQLQTFSSNTQPYARAALMDTLYPHTWCPTHVTPVNMNPVLEFETPFYTNKRFFPARSLNVTDPNFSTSYHTIRLQASVMDSHYSFVSLNSYVSVAEDFNLFFFCYVPTLYSLANPDPSV